MAMLKSELQDWLDTLPDDPAIAIDDGGLAIILVDYPGEAYFELGGLPDVDEEQTP